MLRGNRLMIVRYSRTPKIVGPLFMLGYVFCALPPLPSNDASRQLACFTDCVFFVFSIFRFFEKKLAGGRCPPRLPEFWLGGRSPPSQNSGGLGGSAPQPKFFRNVEKYCINFNLNPKDRECSLRSWWRRLGVRLDLPSHVQDFQSVTLYLGIGIQLEP